MGVTKRKDVRKLMHRVVQAGLDVDEVWDHQDPIEGRSPVVQVVSGGSMPNDMRRGMADGYVYLTVIVFVLHSDATGGWTTEMAEDLIDDISDQLVEVLAHNQTSDLWRGVDYTTQSGIERVTISGLPYLMEVVPITVEVK